jgi:hypothetical protein
LESSAAGAPIGRPAGLRRMCSPTRTSITPAARRGYAKRLTFRCGVALVTPRQSPPVRSIPTALHGFDGSPGPCFLSGPTMSLKPCGKVTSSTGSRCSRYRAIRVVRLRSGADHVLICGDVLANFGLHPKRPRLVLTPPALSRDFVENRRSAQRLAELRRHQPAPRRDDAENALAPGAPIGRVGTDEGSPSASGPRSSARWPASTAPLNATGTAPVASRPPAPPGQEPPPAATR